MNEEIDVIELLKRVKEGKAPKLIEVDDYEYEFNSNYGSIEEIYPSIEEKRSEYLKSNADYNIKERWSNW